MTFVGAEARLQSSDIADDAAQGWYLLGITRRGKLGAVFTDTPDAQLIEYSGLMAVVKPVVLAEFTPAVLHERLQDPTELETAVRSHHRVLEAVHAQQAILPARFGMVYAHADDIVSALQSSYEKLLGQLGQVDGCDEWAVHVYADRTVVRERISSENALISHLRLESADARPGRAFFLERQMRDELEAATRESLATLAQAAFDRLEGFAVAVHVNPSAIGNEATGETEILRGAFLIARAGTEQFLELVRSGTDAKLGVRSECSGPWPPYSFADGDVAS